MNFDEFRNFQERERQKAKEVEEREKEKQQKAKKAKKDKAKAKQESGLAGSDDKVDDSESRGGIGEFLELPQVQTFVVILLLLDTFSNLSQALLSMRINYDERSGAADALALLGGFVSPQMALATLNTFSGFALVFFAFETGLILAVFRGSVYGHWGYLLDACIVGTQLYGELSGWSMEARLLNIFRFWRLVRLVVYMVNLEKAAHEATKETLQDREADIRKFKGDIARAEVELSKEREARGAVDEMLNQYKEDLDTMNEALKIAAMDIVEVAEADDDLLSDDDDVGGDAEVDAEGFSDAAGSKYDKTRNKAEVYANARKDRDDLSITSGSTMASKKRAQSNPTFVVNDDGTFTQK